MKIKCLIIDDEQLARQLLENYIERIPYMELIKSCKSALDAIEYLQKEDIDLIFLDIQMPDLSGIEFLQTIENKPLVIFTTAYKEFALDGYELDISDYMLKPISFERFLQGCNKALKQTKLIKGNKNNKTKNNQFINLKSNHKIYKIKYDDIYYIEGLKEYVTFYTKNKKIVVLESLKKLENTLPSDEFIRIHKSYIINIQSVISIYGNQLEVNGNYLPIGMVYLDTVKRKLFPDI